MGLEQRNIRIGIATDGINLFGNLSTSHTLWHILLTTYNLSPWLCMKRKYILLSMIIFGPKQIGNNIDLYLSPLVEGLRLLWGEGVDVDDSY